MLLLLMVYLRVPYTIYHPQSSKVYRCNAAVGSRMVKVKVGGLLALYCPKLAEQSTVIYVVYTICIKYISFQLFHIILKCYHVQSDGKASAEVFVHLFQTFSCSPERTILLGDIEDIEDVEDLQDQLEIHFQKPSNCGGEIEHIKYMPTGQSLQAIFFCQEMAMEGIEQ